MTDRTRTIRLSAAKADELMDLFEIHPKAQLSQHLTDDQFDAYVAETLKPDEVERLDIHLESCTTCAIEMERRQEEAELAAKLDSELNEMLHDEDPDIRRWASEALTYDRPVATPSVPSITELPGDDQDFGDVLPMIHGLQGVVLAQGIGLARASARTALAAKTSPGWQTGGTSDDRLRSKYRESDKGGIEVRLASKTLRDGASIPLRAGKWFEEVVLHRVRPDQVGAEVVISRKERSDIPRDANLTVDLPPRHPDNEDTGQAQ